MRGAEPALDAESAAGTAEYAADPGVVGDRAGAVEPPEPGAGVAKTGGQAQRAASRGTPEPVERVGAERASPGTGQPGLAGAAAGVLSGHRPSAQHADCLLWALSAHGHRWDGLQHRRYRGQ